ncbi:MAG: UDP-3-O-(3-hydroxymyristoyl)glucosamine N-acyltransferase [Armatimonadetes bacterium]|nr:UDP-3-O-(3-hydroxymyristoyl)glucosamine N-acyltransferase [Armatimonadota bacterium]
MSANTTAARIASLIDGDIEGNSGLAVDGVANVDDAEAGDVVLAEDAKFFRKALESKASCIICGVDVARPCDGKCVIKVARPAEAFARVLDYFRGEELVPAVGIGVGAVVEEGVRLGENVAIGANCFIGRGASLGDGCVAFPNVYVGESVTIGEGTKIYPGVTIYPKCRIGKRVILHAGAVIGADGFGYKPSANGLMKFPHAGIVEIGDDVEIGANSTIDRAKTGATVIGIGTKIDNLVHIAHNVKLGSNCVVVALSGVAGSVEIGNGVTLAAQTGIKDHVRIEDGAVIAARAGVIGNVGKGATVSGFPARDHRSEKRVEAARLHLPDILERLRALEREVKKLQGSGEIDDGGCV